MGPKPAKAGGPEGPEGEDPLQFLQNYKKYCTLLSMDVHKQVVRVLSDEEKFPITQVVIDNEFGPLGAGGTRALMTALLGSGQGMRGGPYKLLKSVRLWRSNGMPSCLLAIYMPCLSACLLAVFLCAAHA